MQVCSNSSESIHICNDCGFEPGACHMHMHTVQQEVGSIVHKGADAQGPAAQVLLYLSHVT